MQAPHNKSLDASGVSGLAIDNLFVTQLTAAASTPPLCPGAFENMAAGDVRPVVAVAAIARDRWRAHLEMRWCGRALCPALNGSVRSTRAGHNKSLDASGVSSSLSDNLSVT